MIDQCAVSRYCRPEFPLYQASFNLACFITSLYLVYYAPISPIFFFLNDPATTDISPLPLPAALPILLLKQLDDLAPRRAERAVAAVDDADRAPPLRLGERDDGEPAAALLVEHRRARDDGRA